MTAALQRALTTLLLGVVPLFAVAAMFAVAHSTGSMSADFHNEIYPQAKLMLNGTDPYPEAGTEYTIGPNYVWPPAAALAATPLTLLPRGAADGVAALVELLAFCAALWLVGVRDWRVIGATMLWPQVLGEIRVAHFSLILCLLVAIVWRTRDRPWAPGVALGVAIAVKLFVWPLVIWLAARRRYRDAALAACLAAGSLVLLAAYTDPVQYIRVLRELGAAYDQDSYSLYGLIVQLGAPGIAGSLVTLAVGIAFIAIGWQRRSFGLMVGACLVMSPIVWLDYYALLAVPLAIVRPRFGVIWLLPIVTWGIPSAGFGIGDPMHSLRVLLVFSIVLASIVRGEGRRPSHALADGSRPALAARTA
jgi:hypothetical protein